AGVWVGKCGVGCGGKAGDGVSDGIGGEAVYGDRGGDVGGRGKGWAGRPAEQVPGGDTGELERRDGAEFADAHFGDRGLHGPRIYEGWWADQPAGGLYGRAVV